MIKRGGVSLNTNFNPKVDEYVRESEKWKVEIEKLRKVSLDCGLTEEFKWRKPCYSFQGSNIAIIQPFKEYCALMFFKGVLLKDPKGRLVAPGENSQTQRQFRFTSVQAINELEHVIKDYIHEAIEIEQAGKEVTFKKTAEYTIPEELQTKFNEHPALKTAFEALTPGRQRAYIIYFTKPKQSKTRESRIEKYVQHILSGKGLNE
ncbi:YdeI/OmpD-associated family protein [Fredinandcohnia sp. 179-A 10B2 NHS]|uniref:YdeI/OmpD-associated family protein n=1 Tax=Fredinandcohnia sp. 179-A 10B2 NHS TaxID=3235176 RepID=UPI0039A32F60